MNKNSKEETISKLIETYKQPTEKRWSAEVERVLKRDNIHIPAHIVSEFREILRNKNDSETTQNACENIKVFLEVEYANMLDDKNKNDNK